MSKLHSKLRIQYFGLGITHAASCMLSVTDTRNHQMN